MEAKDGSKGFDFAGIYEKVTVNKRIDNIIGDGRKVTVVFSAVDNLTEIFETFESEDSYSIQMQHDGWQSILNNFKKYAERNK